jgi:hypothetical protein
MSSPRMTTDLHRAMARYELARGRFRTTVLASLRGAAAGEAIRSAIQECKVAGEELRRLKAYRSQLAAA